jgi:hypothetical protein
MSRPMHGRSERTYRGRIDVSYTLGVVDERAAVVASARRLGLNALGADLDVLPRAYELCTTRE